MPAKLYEYLKLAYQACRFSILVLCSIRPAPYSVLRSSCLDDRFGRQFCCNVFFLLYLWQKSKISNLKGCWMHVWARGGRGRNVICLVLKPAVKEYMVHSNLTKVSYILSCSVGKPYSGFSSEFRSQFGLKGAQA